MSSAPATTGFCTRCGAPRPDPAAPCGRCGALPPGQGSRNRVGAALLALFFGWTGAHKFYLGRWGWGIVYLLTGCVSWIAGLVDFVRLLLMDDAAFQRRYPGQGNTVGAVLAIVLPIFCAVPTAGMLAAIAIPNFIRYQLRAKASEAPLVLGQLARAEAERVAGGGELVILRPLPAALVSGKRRALTPDEAAALRELGVEAGPALYGQYRVEVIRDEASGLKAAALCAEMDLDEDGHRAAWVAFLPAVKDGRVVVAPPPAPCSDLARLPPGALDYAGQAAGEVSKASEESVF